MLKKSILSCLFLINSVSYAQSEPVDKNFPGPFVGVGFDLGQAQAAGKDSNPDAALQLGAEFGYVMKKDTWNRVELGASIGYANLNMKIDGNKVKVTQIPQLLLKAGYGYSLGNNVFGVFRLGAGVGLGEYETTVSSVTTEGDASAFIAMLGWDVVYPASESTELVFGANFKSYSVNVDDINGQSVESVQVNVPGLMAQVRFRI